MVSANALDSANGQVAQLQSDAEARFSEVSGLGGAMTRADPDEGSVMRRVDDDEGSIMRRVDENQGMPGLQHSATVGSMMQRVDDDDAESVM